MSLDTIEVFTGELIIERNRLKQVVCDIEIISPPIPKNKKEIGGWNLPKKEQKFQRTIVPKSFASDEEEDAFIAQEFKRRREGYWFYIKGQPMWITGIHYVYLNYWKIDIGLPKYRDADRRYFWFWDYCEKDKNCYGMQELTRRRQGKSFRGGVIIWHRTTIAENRYGGIQSKTNSDGKSLFARSIVAPWRKLPYFFVNKFDGTNNPKTELRFFAPAVRGKKATEGEEISSESELGSWIDFRSSVEIAYDGEKLHTYFADEIGKTTEVNVYDRWGVVKPCLEDLDKIIGKSIQTSTAEEMTKGGGDKFKALWDESDVSKRDGLGRTTSGLYRYFLPAYDGFLEDEYGNSLIAESKRILLAERESKQGNYIELSKLKRKKPFTVAEAFITDTNDCYFNTEKIYDRLSVIDTPYWNGTVTGNLVWVGNVQDSTVYFDPNPQGRFKMSSTGVPPEDQNKVNRSGSYPIPLNINYVIGCDNYDLSKTIDGRASQAAAYGFRKYDPTIDPTGKPIKDFQTNKFILQYHARPATVFDFYEDMIKMVSFLGCQINSERNKPGLKNYFELRGYKHFLMERPEVTKTSAYNKNDKTTGTPMTRETASLMVDYIEAYLGQDIDGVGSGHGYVDLVDFPELLKDWLEFDVEDTTKFDLTVASGHTLIAASKHVKPEKKASVTNFIRRFDNSDVRSKLVS